MNQLNIFQILKNGTSFKPTVKEIQQKSRKSSVDSQTFEKFHLQKYNVDDSESEKEVQIETKRRRKESIDQLEQELVKKQRQHQEQINKLLKTNKIKRSGDNLPNPCSNFTKMMNTLNIDRKIISNVKKAGYLQPTPIQMQAIPAILHNRNLIAVAPTGSGKTAAYAIPILQLLAHHKTGGPRCLLFSPSLELGLQLLEQMNLFKIKEGKQALRIKFLSKMNRDKIAFRQSLESVDVLICTPLKFLRLHKRSPINIQLVEYLVMDESDKYFELGLLSQIKQILAIAQTNPQLTYLLFSATIQDPVEKLFLEIMIDPIKIQVGGKNHVLNSIDHSGKCMKYKVFYSPREILDLINNGQFTPPVLIFVQSKERAEELLHQIKQMKIHTQLRIDCIHGNKESSEREQLIRRFETGDLWILICTDLLARGIDFKGVKLVINYDFPNSMINYIHRVGRTGRAGTSGKAVTFFTDDDKPLLRSLANVLKISGCQVPEWIFTLKKLTKVDLKHAEKFPIKRESINESRAYSNFKKVKYQDEHECYNFTGTYKNDVFKLPPKRQQSPFTNRFINQPAFSMQKSITIHSRDEIEKQSKSFDIILDRKFNDRDIYLQNQMIGRVVNQLPQGIPKSEPKTTFLQYIGQRHHKTNQKLQRLFSFKTKTSISNINEVPKIAEFSGILKIKHVLNPDGKDNYNRKQIQRRTIHSSMHSTIHGSMHTQNTSMTKPKQDQRQILNPWNVQNDYDGEGLTSRLVW